MRDTLRTESTKHHGISHGSSTATPIRQNNESSSSNGGSGNVSNRTPRKIPSPSKYSIFPTDNKAETVVDGDNIHVNGAKFPIADAQKHSSSPTTDSFREKRSYIIEERAEPVSLEGVVDLTNTVDTTVNEKVAPAVTHEKILPTEHEIITRAIYREIHQHHYYHRALPVIDTEILPTKHYVYGDDGDTLIRIPESMVPCHTLTGSHSQNWSIVQHRPAPAKDPFNSPLFGVEPELPDTKYTTHFQPNSKGQLQWSHVPGEPIKVMEREYITAEGFPRKETWWRYPPVLATAAYEAGLTVPMYWNHVPAGTEQPVTKAPVSTSQTQNKIKEIRDLERAQAAEYNSIDHLDSNMEKLRTKKRYSGLSNSDSAHAQELNGLHSTSIPRKPIAHQKIPERPPTRDSGYDGLDGNYSPNAKESSHYRHSSGSSISSLLGKVRGDDGKKPASVEGEATKYLQRMREKRRSLGSSVGTIPRSWGRRSEDIHGGPALTDRPKKPEHLFGEGTAI